MKCQGDNRHQTGAWIPFFPDITNSERSYALAVQIIRDNVSLSQSQHYVASANSILNKQTIEKSYQDKVQRRVRH